MDLREHIRDIVDFPQEGIIFRDITTLLKDPDALCCAIDKMAESIKDLDFDCILGPESRGFIFGMPLAYQMKKGFIPVRKKGKLPGAVVEKEYALEYGTATIAIHKDAIQPGQRVLIIDDLLATGGTAKAVAELIEEVGGIVVGFSFLIELLELGGRKALEGYEVQSIVTY